MPWNWDLSPHTLRLSPSSTRRKRKQQKLTSATLTNTYIISCISVSTRNPRLLAIPGLQTLIPVRICMWPILSLYSILPQLLNPSHCAFSNSGCRTGQNSLSPQPLLSTSFHLIFPMKGFSTSMLLTFGPGNSLLWGSVLCVVEYFIAYLAFIH